MQSIDKRAFGWKEVPWCRYRKLLYRNLGNTCVGITRTKGINTEHGYGTFLLNSEDRSDVHVGLEVIGLILSLFGGPRCIISRINEVAFNLKVISGQIQQQFKLAIR